MAQHVKNQVGADDLRVGRGEDGDDQRQGGGTYLHRALVVSAMACHRSYGSMRSLFLKGHRSDHSCRLEGGFLSCVSARCASPLPLWPSSFWETNALSRMNSQSAQVRPLPLPRVHPIVPLFAPDPEGSKAARSLSDVSHYAGGPNMKHWVELILTATRVILVMVNPALALSCWPQFRPSPRPLVEGFLRASVDLSYHNPSRVEPR